jgi:hypothetical protein
MEQIASQRVWIDAGKLNHIGEDLPAFAANAALSRPR